MRILGGHDYFDSALAFGRDESLVLTRRRFKDAPLLPHKSCGLPVPSRDGFSFTRGQRASWHRDQAVEHRGTRYEFSPQTVWFAGKRYGGVRVTGRERAFSARPESTEWFWSEDSFREYLDRIEARLANPKHWGTDSNFDESNISEHFEGDGGTSGLDWMAENRASIAIWARHTLYWNERNGWKVDTDGLGAMGFAKRLDPFTAFQELSMWVGGVLPRSANPMVEIRSEKVILGKHGMDEWSFKTPPSKGP